MTNPAETVALSYLDAVGRKDCDRVATLLAPDIRFVGPVMTIQGAPEVVAWSLTGVNELFILVR